MSLARATLMKARRAGREGRSRACQALLGLLVGGALLAAALAIRSITQAVSFHGTPTRLLQHVRVDRCAGAGCVGTGMGHGIDCGCSALAISPQHHTSGNRKLVCHGNAAAAAVACARGQVSALGCSGSYAGPGMGKAWP